MGKRSTKKPSGTTPPQKRDAAECGCTHEDRTLALRVMTLTRDTNQYGTIFGGIILSYIDQAGFVEARRHGRHRWVTASVDRVDFHQPVHLGDVVNCYACTTRLGRTSVTVCVDVEAERYETGETVRVTTAMLTMVAVDAQGRSIPFSSPPTIGVDE
ncbi:MAG: acyl-CoA thioesterase [Phycisphaeraceae bacterium]|nr:acyl-CoA thioesterase [Phycisphaerales bacterium]MCB9859769.1 acyl-CoA thioesterase [Phycisphaeraceae bacterium]